MKICITSVKGSLDSKIDPRFGRCQYFVIVDENGKLIKSMKNQGTQAMHGAGISAAQIIANEKVDAVITGNIGPKAFDALQSSGIEIFPGVHELTIKQAFEKYKGNELKRTTEPTGPGHGSKSCES